MAMKNKKFMTLVLAGMVSIQVVGCGASAGSDTERNSEIVTETENVSEMETEKGTETQASSETESETQVATNDNTEDESDKKDEDSKDDGKKDEDDKKDEESNKPSEPEKPVHTCNFATLKTDANNHWYACSCGNTSGKGAHGYDDEYDASCNTCGYTRSVPERPTPPSDEKESINFTGGSMTLPTIGVDIPKLPHFNSAALQPGGDIWWSGSESDPNAMSGMNTIYYTVDKVVNKLLEQGKIGNDSSNFSVTRNAIVWNWLGAGGASDFELQKSETSGYYTLTINCDLRDHQLGVMQYAPYNQDILRTMLSFITPNVNEVFDYLWGSMYKDIASYPMYTDRYVTVSDCKIKLDKYFVYGDGKYSHVKFYIAPK